MPGNVKHSIFDEVHWVSAPEAFRATRELFATHAMFQGPTSGAAYLVARWWAKNHPDKTVVTMFPDSGNRYLQTVYNPTWLSENGLLRDAVPSGPLEVFAPAQVVAETWSCMDWGQRAHPDAHPMPFGLVDREAQPHVASLY
jgi:cysteine synthase A